MRWVTKRLSDFSFSTVLHFLDISVTDCKSCIDNARKVTHYLESQPNLQKRPKNLNCLTEIKGSRSSRSLTVKLLVDKPIAAKPLVQLEPDAIEQLFEFHDISWCLAPRHKELMRCLHHRSLHDNIEEVTVFTLLVWCHYLRLSCVSFIVVQQRTECYNMHILLLLSTWVFV